MEVEKKVGGEFALNKMSKLLGPIYLEKILVLM